MHNLAIALQLNGCEVTGSDDEIFEPSKSRLKERGLLPEKQGWYPDKITKNMDAIILGMHARPDNPELLRAQDLGIKIYSYPEFLYYHSQDKVRVVIGGSHGKTSITGMVMHVLKNEGLLFDYLVGSKLKDFDVMVKLSKDAPIMIFEGDEYLSSPIDRRPKFHWYKPNIALLSGIAWDHINVFPTEKEYNNQFSIFIDLMQKNGTLIYCREDEKLKEIVDSARNDISKLPYSLPIYKIEEGITTLQTEGGPVGLKIFGKHNLLNLNGARLICNALGIKNEQFYHQISTFDGAANRLELVKKKGLNRLYKDFAHAPSKVKATIDAVREQFPDHKLVGCLELHTFSSLNRNFLNQYQGSFDELDAGCIYYNPHALKLKRLPDLNPEDIALAFNFKNLSIFADSSQLLEFLLNQKNEKVIYLMMSSGNFDGIELEELAKNAL